MIKLNVENYCDNCPDFDPKVDVLISSAYPNFTYVICEHRNRCDAIAKHIEQVLKKEV